LLLPCERQLRCSCLPRPLDTTNTHAMLDSRLVSGPREGESVPPGSAFQWVLANSGTEPWPEATTLRLIGGPALTCPIVEVPAIAPGQTVVVDLEVQETQEPADTFYALVTPDCQPFGEILAVKVARTPKVPTPSPVCVVTASPMDGLAGGLGALQSEVKTVEWTLANIGQVPWPKDTVAVLIFNTPGFDHLPTDIQIPVLEPGMTVHVGVTALMPKLHGSFKAMWAVMSPTHADFGDILVVEFQVNDALVSECKLAEGNTAETPTEAQSASSSSSSSECELSKVPRGLSAALVYQNHLVPGEGQVDYGDVADGQGFAFLGSVSGLAAGTPWFLELALANDGPEAWPEDVALMCCLGDGLGCVAVPLGTEAVPPGGVACVTLELRAPVRPCRTAWVLASEDKCFGPVLVLELQ